MKTLVKSDQPTIQLDRTFSGETTKDKQLQMAEITEEESEED